MVNNAQVLTATTALAIVLAAPTTAQAQSLRSQWFVEPTILFGASVLVQVGPEVRVGGAIEAIIPQVGWRACRTHLVRCSGITDDAYYGYGPIFTGAVRLGYLDRSAFLEPQVRAGAAFGAKSPFISAENVALSTDLRLGYQLRSRGWEHGWTAEVAHSQSFGAWREILNADTTLPASPGRLYSLGYQVHLSREDRWRTGTVLGGFGRFGFLPDPRPL